MAGHTKGPWRVDETKALGAYGVWTDYATHPGHDGAGYPSQVCSMGPTTRSEITREQRDANARLIAAAPDLLAALRSLYGWKHCMRTVEPDQLEAALAAAMAAIAKAEGGPNP
jgi:hypothetical protein